MKKFLAVLVLWAVASPALADLTPGLTVQIDPSRVNWTVAGNGQTGTSVMSVNLLMQSNAGDTNLCNDFAASMWLTGVNGASFAAASSYLSYQSATTLANYVSPQNYAWAAFDGPAGAQAQPSGIGEASNRLDFDLGDSYAHSQAISAITPGEVLATFFFTYNGDHTTFSQVYAWVGNEGQTGGEPTFNTDAFTEDGAAVSNPGVNLAPEPATLGLVAFGMSCLLVRRKKR